MRLVALAVAGLWLTPGCSFVFLQRVPHDYEEGDEVECTTSRALPTVDTILVLTHVASLIYLSEAYKGSNRDALARGDVFSGLFLASSAIFGYWETGYCAQAQRAQVRGRYPHVPRAPRPIPPIGPSVPPPSYRPSAPTTDQALPESPVSPLPPGSATPAAPQQQDDDDPSVRKRPRPSNQGPTDRAQFGN